MTSIAALERQRGVRYDRPVNWEALELVIQTTEGSPLQKKLFRKKFLKAIREHGPQSMTPWFRYHYVCARLYLGDYSDYWGWECRGLREDGDSEDWAASLYWQETWLPKWGGGNVERLLVLGEQGVGDQIFAASILPEALLRAREVYFECDDRLHSILERSFPRLKCRKERDFEDRREDYGPIDAFIPAMDLMRMFRRDRKHFPGKTYLKPSPEKLAKVEKYRGRVGVSWSGRQGAIDPQKLGIERPLCLQYHADKFNGVEMERPHINLWSDIEGIVALCSVLGKVVTVPTSVHHMAGAVGTRTEIIVPEIQGEEVPSTLRWDYPPGKLPWYQNAHVYRNVEEWKSSSGGLTQ